MSRSGEFVPARACAPAAVAALLARQPPTPAKIAFAWQMAVGPALARVTSARYENGLLRVAAPDARWTREIERSREVILERLRPLVGADVIRELSCETR